MRTTTAAAVPNHDACAAYAARHTPAIESALSHAVDACFAVQADEPLRFIADELLKQHGAAGAETAPHPRGSYVREETAESDYPTAEEGEWSITAWCASLGIHQHVARALQGERSSSESQVAFIRSLASPSGHDTVIGLLRSGALLERVATEVHRQAQALARAEAATAQELVAKFCEDGSSFAMTFSGLSTFFSGLEGLIGSPSPRLADAIAREHCKSVDSHEDFTTPNYSVTTSSSVEFHFVVEPSTGLAKLGRDAWPVEAGLAGGQIGREAKPLSSFDEPRAAINARLAKLDAPPLGEFELMAARLYTGPMYVKYNAILRGGLPSSPARDAERFASLCKGNRYVTTLHCINSAVVKLSKLQKACKVYRGISNGVLPKEFFEPDADSGVRGGVESGFMSTTTSRDVALSYAGGGGAGKVATVLEIQTGMVDRGASLEWISQYPGEAEILFAPLAGLEVVSTRVEGSVLIVEVRVAVNLMSLTIEQAVSKRRKVVMDMAENMKVELMHEVEGKSWAALRALVPDAGRRARQALDDQLSSVTSEPPEFYNNDDKLGASIKGAVDSKSFVSRWPHLLLDNVSPMQRATVGDQQLLKRYLSKSDKLVHTCDPERGGTPLVDKPHGINPVLARLSLANRLRELTLSGNRLTDANLRALCGAMRLNDRARLTLLCLDGNLLTTLDPLLPLLPDALCELRRLDLGRNKLREAAIKSLADALPAATQLRRVDVLLQTSFLSAEAASYLVAKAEACVAQAKLVPWPKPTGNALTRVALEGQLADDPLATFIPRDADPTSDTAGMEDWGMEDCVGVDDPDAAEGGAARLRLVRYGGVPVFDDPHDNGGISLCGRRMMGPALVLAEQKLPALSDADVTLIAVSVRLLGAARTLTKLDLSGNRITSVGVVSLMEAFTATPTRQLKILSLANNSVNRTGVEAVAAALHALDLVQLSLGYSYVGSTVEGMSALGAALKHAPSLELLYLQRCDMTSASLASLIAGMRGHVPRLRRMLLDSNIKAVHGLGEVLRAAPALEELHVQNCGLSDASELTAALEDPEVAPKLGELALGANSIAADSLNALREVAAAKRNGLKLTNAEDQSPDTAAVVGPAE